MKKWYLANKDGVMNTCSFNNDGTVNQTVDEHYLPLDCANRLDAGQDVPSFTIRRRIEHDKQIWVRVHERLGL